MKRKLMALMMIGLMSSGFVGCQGTVMTQADSCWAAAKNEDSLEDYLEAQENKLDLETLQQEAVDEELSLRQQFKATALLCAWESQSLLDESGDSSYAQLTGRTDDAMFQMDYPMSSSYANAYFEKVNTQEEEFWASMEEAFHPYDCFYPMIAAADELDGQTLANLVKGIPDGEMWGRKLKDAIGKWVEAHPERMTEYVDALVEAGFYDDWDAHAWKNTYINNSLDPYSICTGTVDDALSYIWDVRESLIPRLESEFGEEFMVQSGIEEGIYYKTGLAVTVDEVLHLQEASEEEIPESIDLEGKKVIAFYCNPSGEEFPYSPTTLRVLGDFMLGLPQEEYPAALNEADYYLVLTAAYEYGEMYQNSSGNDTEIQEVLSRTSVDLYEAETGRFLRHLGNLLEEAPDFIIANWSDKAPRYPELTAADVLSYIYHNANEPEKYAFLMDNTAEQTEMARGEAIILGNWEVTYHSCQILKEFDQSIFRYTADDGCQFVLGEFTVKNIGNQTDSFLPLIYNTQEDVLVRIVDVSTEEIYEFVNLLGGSGCVNGSSLEPGESKDGKLIFQVSDEALQNTESLYVIVSLGRQSLGYRLE